MDILDKPRWRWSFFTEDASLLESLKTVGQLLPIWALKSGEIVDGFKRFWALSALGVEPQIMTVENQEGLFEKIFNLNLFSPKNILDRGQIFLTLKEHYGDDVPDSFLKKLGFKDLFTAKKVSRYLFIPQNILKIVLNYGWAESVYEKLGRFEDEELLLLEKTVFTWSLNQNKIIQILDYLFETSRRDKIATHTLLGEFKGQDADGLREFLYQKRYPRFSAQQDEFRKKVKDLKIPAGMTVEPKDAFETERVEVKVTLDNLEDLKKFIQK
ncbi:hypothetical protein K1X76_07935 [bacterium]|nr:hypothetical protein [bacterium]